MSDFWTLIRLNPQRSRKQRLTKLDDTNKKIDAQVSILNKQIQNTYNAD